MKTKNRDQKTGGTGGTILVVDDNEDLCRTLTTLLQVIGNDVLQAADGLEGLTIFSIHQESIDRILTDNDMPRMTGLEMIGKVRAMNKKVKILFMSGRLDSELEKQAMKAGANLVFKKPLMINAVLEALKHPHHKN